MIMFSFLAYIQEIKTKNRYSVPEMVLILQFKMFTNVSFLDLFYNLIILCVHTFYICVYVNNFTSSQISLIELKYKHTHATMIMNT